VPYGWFPLQQVVSDVLVVQVSCELWKYIKFVVEQNRTLK